MVVEGETLFEHLQMILGMAALFSPPSLRLSFRAFFVVVLRLSVWIPRDPRLGSHAVPLGKLTKPLFSWRREKASQPLVWHFPWERGSRSRPCPGQVA